MHSRVERAGRNRRVHAADGLGQFGTHRRQGVDDVERAGLGKCDACHGAMVRPRQDPSGSGRCGHRPAASPGTTRARAHVTLTPWGRTSARRDLIRWSALGAGAGPMLAALSACTGSGGRSSSAQTLSPTSTSSAIAPSPSVTTPSTATTAAPASTATPCRRRRPSRSTRPGRGGCRATCTGRTRGRSRSSSPCRARCHRSCPGCTCATDRTRPSGDSPHWFLGDGMVHGVRLDGGKAVAYRNRYVQTALYETPAPGSVRAPPGGASNQSNVSAIWHGGRLLTQRRGRASRTSSIRPTCPPIGALRLRRQAQHRVHGAPEDRSRDGSAALLRLRLHAAVPDVPRRRRDGTFVHSEVVDTPRRR